MPAPLIVEYVLGATSKASLVPLLAICGACAPVAQEPPAVPLYPNPEVPRQADDLAKLFGPIGWVDGREVQGDAFDLLPGCHIVKLHAQMERTNSYVSWTGRVPETVFAIRMKAGHRYIIRRDILENMGGSTGRLVVTARDEDSAGTETTFGPARNAEDVEACKSGTGGDDEH